jgi:GPH family glycoside/pentoside/hexuronide:cation symporter
MARHPRGLVIQLFGYIPNQAQQEPQALLGIRLLYGPLPAAIMLGALLLFWRFPVTRERHAEIQAALRARRAQS